MNKTEQKRGYIDIPLDNVKLVATKFNINMSSVLYSSILGVVRQYIKSVFPPDFFNSEFVQNSIYTISEQGVSDDEAVNVRPALTIAMKYDEEEASFSGDEFMYGNLYVKRGAWLNPQTYKRLAWDRNRMFYLTASSSRAKNNFEFIITLNSEAQAINTLGYLKSKLGTNRPYFLNKRYIEVPIPATLIGAIAKIQEIDISKASDMEAFNNIIHAMSGGRITFKLHKSSGRFAYFYKYRANILFKVTSYDTIDREMADKSVVGSTVKFTVSAEYETHTNFIAEAYRHLDPIGPLDYGMVVSEHGTGIISHTTEEMPISSQIENGQFAIFSTSIITDINVLLDETELKEYLNKDFLEYTEFLLKEDPTQELLKTKVTPKLYRDGKELKEGLDFDMDWKIMKLLVHIPYANYDHRFIIYVELAELNDFIDNRNQTSNI